MYKQQALLALLWPAVALAQGVPQQAAQAAAPDAPVPAPTYQPMPAVGASALVRELDDWKSANATVGQYRRGHHDIVKSERAQAAPAPQPQAAPAENAR
jgi:hypothetical protein